LVARLLASGSVLSPTPGSCPAVEWPCIGCIHYRDTGARLRKMPGDPRADNASGDDQDMWLIGDQAIHPRLATGVAQASRRWLRPLSP